MAVSKGPSWPETTRIVNEGSETDIKQVAEYLLTTRTSDFFEAGRAIWKLGETPRYVREALKLADRHVGSRIEQLTLALHKVTSPIIQHDELLLIIKNQLVVEERPRVAERLPWLAFYLLPVISKTPADFRDGSAIAPELFEALERLGDLHFRRLTFFNICQIGGDEVTQHLRQLVSRKSVNIKGFKALLEHRLRDPNAYVNVQLAGDILPPNETRGLG